MLKEEIINKVICSMHMLSGEELAILRGVLLIAFDGIEVVRSQNQISTEVLDDNELVQRFLIQKKIDGLSKELSITIESLLKSGFTFISRKVYSNGLEMM